MVATRRKREILFVIGLAAVLAVLLWLASDVLTPFIVGLLLAYLLDPMVQRLCGYGVPRPLVALGVTLLMLFAVIGLLSALGPLVYGQMQELFHNLPQLFTRLMSEVRVILLPYTPILRTAGFGELVRPVAQATASQSELMGSLLTGGMAFLTFFGLSLLTPMITYYLLADWEQIMLRTERIIPNEWHADAVELARRIDRVLSGFFRGQAWVCAAVAVVYAAGLTAAGLQYGFVIGILSGIFKFVPYVGTAAGLTLGVAAALTQAGADSWLLGGVLATYAVTEALESSFLTPRLIGSRVKLHPVVVILSILLGGKLFGAAGVFFAVPVVAVGRVLLVFFLWRDGIPARPAKLDAGLMD